MIINFIDLQDTEEVADAPAEIHEQEMQIAPQPVLANVSTEQDKCFSPARCVKRKRVGESIGITNMPSSSRLNEEARLRIEKLKRSIEQQEELHKIKVEAAEAERDYWRQKTNLML